MSHVKIIELFATYIEPTEYAGNITLLMVYSKVRMSLLGVESNKLLKQLLFLKAACEMARMIVKMWII